MQHTYRLWDVANGNFVGDTFDSQMLAANAAYWRSVGEGRKYQVRIWTFEYAVSA